MLAAATPAPTRKCKSLTPAKNSIPAMVAASTTVPPKSGSSSSSTANVATMALG